MTIDLKQVNTLYKQWLAAHPKLAGLLVVAESAAIGAMVDATANGIDLSKNGVKHMVTFVVMTVLVAVRNYARSNVSNLKLQQSLAAAPGTN